MNVADFSSFQNSAQHHSEPRLAQKKIDGHPMHFVGAVVFQGQDELAIRLPFRFDRHRVG